MCVDEGDEEEDLRIWSREKVEPTLQADTLASTNTKVSSRSAAEDKAVTN